MEKIKVGIIGFGFMGHNHADMVQSFDEMELVAVCDTNPEQLTDVPAGVKIYDNADDLLKEDINVVIIFLYRLCFLFE